VIEVCPTDADLTRQALAEEMQKVGEQIRRLPQVAEAIAARDAALDNKHAIRRALRHLNAAAVDGAKRIRLLKDAIRDRLIAHFADSTDVAGDPAAGELAEALAQQSALHDAMMWAGQHGAPLAEISVHRCEGEVLHRFARELRAIAEQRLTETLAAMRPVIEREGGLGFDPSSTTSGQMLREADQIVVKAEAELKLASDIEQTYLAKSQSWRP
jgi:hypothetical protein